MTPQELAKLAKDSCKEEYDSLMSELEKAAKEGRLLYVTQAPTKPGTIARLKDEGFTVEEVHVMQGNPKQYKVSFDSTTKV